MPFFSIVLAMADLHHRPRSTSKTAQTLDFIGYRGACPQKWWGLSPKFVPKLLATKKFWTALAKKEKVLL